jgi:FKBP-type peptidyl-prolyl cis-trans isomerase FklB
MQKRNWFVGCGWVLLTTAVLAQEGPVIKSDQDKLSYSIGVAIGKNFKNEGTEVNVGLLMEGLMNSLAGYKLLVPEKEMRQVMNDYQTQLRQKMTAKRQQAVLDNKKMGEAYLTDYQSQPGVLSSPSGVLYKVVKQGTGKKPAESDLVEVNYRGALINGTEFDATEPGHPAKLKVSALIPGWKQSLSMMPVGSSWHIVIPAVLAYGERGVGNDIGPNEVLVFDLELLGIQ